MKTIIATRKTKPLSLDAYGDSIRVIDNATNLVLYQGKVSTNPNPTAAAGKILWFNSYAQVAPGEYRFRFIKNHPKYKKTLLINEGTEIPTTNANRNHQGRRVATEIFIHTGWKNTWRGSRGCLTVPPKDAESFFSIFKDGETGAFILKDETSTGSPALSTLLFIAAGIAAAIYLTKPKI